MTGLTLEELELRDCMETRMTAGATRTLGLAARMAASGGEGLVLPEHLLAALLGEESPATSQLLQAGISLETVQEQWPGIGIAEEDRTFVELPARGVELISVLQRALARAHAGGRPDEIGTLDLLGGLLEVEGKVAEFLGEFGLNPEMFLKDDPAERTGSGHPLPVEETLRWKSEAAEQHVTACRIVDASLNRVREGLRVLEDYARFHLNDGHLSGLLKGWRHDLAEAQRGLPEGDLIAARDTFGDVGTGITLGGEGVRRSLGEVMEANLKRLQEASRTLEEYGKILSADFGASMKQLRYRLYTLEKGLQRTAVGRRRLSDQNLYLLVTEELCHHGSGPAIRGALEGGVQIIQVREKRMPDRQLVEHARRIREWTREYGALLIMNDRPDLAVLVDADGVHVGQEELSVQDARRIVGGDRLVGVSTHSVEQARRAVLDGADYIGVGPVFPSKTKQFDAFVGLELVRQVCGEISLPAFAIGGIDATNVRDVRDAGGERVAVSSAICSAENPEIATRELLRLLQNQKS